jgi:oligopeptidase B
MSKWICGTFACGMVLVSIARLTNADEAPAAASAMSAAATLTPPAPAIRPHVTELHGRTREDNYYWLRERERPEVIEHLKAENAYLDAVLGHTADLQATLFEEMKSRIQQTDLSAPTRVDDWFYYERTIEGKQYPIRCRKFKTLDAPEEVLLDINELAAGHDYFRVGAFNVSPDHNLLAYSVDLNGAELYTLHVKDLRTGKLLPDEVRDITGATAWASDNKTLFYVRDDSARRPYQVWRHTLGTPTDADVKVFQEDDPLFMVHVGRMLSDAFIEIAVESKMTSESWLLPANEPTGAFRVVAPRMPGVEYSVDHRGDTLYILTNADGATNFKLMTAPVASPGRENWKDFWPYDPATPLDNVLVLRDHLIVTERTKGLRNIRIRDLRDGSEHRIQFDEPTYSVSVGGNREFDTNILRFSYTSMTSPTAIFDYDLNARTRTLVKKTEVLGGYDPSNYETSRLYAVAPDGVQVPISIVHRKGLKLDGSNPTLLSGYGSYGFPRDPGFSSNIISLLDRGFVYAIGHIRGGGDLGRAWYEDGKLLKKKNTFTDFVACAEHLIQQGYTRPDKLAIEGGSAGGLLVGATLNLRPELFGAAIAHVPFVDVVNSMLDESLPLTVGEFEEWGNPKEREYGEYMLSYSPYDNIRKAAYPPILATTGLNDPRVAYWEPAKWVAKLRTMKTDRNPVVLRVNLGAGHGGASGRYDRLREIALDYAFLIDRIGNE